MRAKIVFLILFISVMAGFQMADANRGGYDFGSPAAPGTVDTGAIVDEAVTKAKLIDGANIGDMLWYDGTDWLDFDANEPNDILVLNDANQPVWEKKGITVENNITNNIVNNLKLKKTATFSDGDIVTVNTSGNTFTGNTLAELSAAQPLSAIPAGIEQYWRFTQADPTALLALDAEWVFDPNTEAAVTIQRAYGSLDADPTTELDADLYFADAGVGYANETLINTFNTTDGVVYITSFTDGTVPANKKVYLKLVAVDAATTQINAKITYTRD